MRFNDEITVKSMLAIQDELRSAYSMCFSLDGRFLYGGYERAIRIFDMASSGRQVKEIPTWSKFGFL